MSDHQFITALTGAGTVVAVGLTVMARAWGTTYPAKHRAADLLDEADLLGPPSAYTTVDPNAETQAFGVIRTGFGWCQPCQSTTAGVITRNGFRCGECLTPAAAGGAGWAST